MDALFNNLISSEIITFIKKILYFICLANQTNQQIFGQ